VIIVRLKDYLRYEKELSGYVKKILKNINMVLLSDEALPVLNQLKIKYIRSSRYKITSIPIPTPIVSKLKGLEFTISPDRLFYLTVEPLISEFRGYIALDMYHERPICVLDTGVFDKHRIFTDNYIILEKKSVVDDEGDDKEGHGTHVQGIIATLSPYSRIVSIKVFKGSETTTDILLMGLDMCKELNCAVVNMSLGGYPSKEEIELMDEVLEDLKTSGIVPVVASGNEASITRVSYPGSSRHVITVGSVNVLLLRSYFSNVDPFNKKPEVMAFGEKVLSASNEDRDMLVEKSGTSMATPVVSAISYYLHYFHNIARQTSYLPLNILGAVLDPRLDPFNAVKNALIQLSIKNNPLLEWNTSYAWGICSFRKLIPQIDFQRSLQFKKIYPIHPPMFLPELVEKYPDYLTVIIEKLLALGMTNIVLNVIYLNREKVLEILFKNPSLAEMLVTLLPDIVNILPELINMYPYLLEMVKGKAITWESISDYIESRFMYYFPSFEDETVADTKLLVAYFKGLSSVIHFTLTADNPVTLNVYLTNDLRVEGGDWNKNKWYGGVLAENFVYDKKYEYGSVVDTEDNIISDHLYVVFEAIGSPGTKIYLSVKVRK